MRFSAREVIDQDELATAQVIADLTVRGVQPCVTRSQYLPFDLVAVMPDMRTMYRLRVGYGSVRREAETDYYVIYDPNAKQAHSIRAEDAPHDADVISVDTSGNAVSHLNGAFVG